MASHSEEKRVEVVEMGYQKEAASPVKTEHSTVHPSSSLDSLPHSDAASRIIDEYLAEGGSADWTKEEEKRLLRKVDWRLGPVLAFSVLLQLYDKTILSQAVRTSQP